MKRKSLVQGFSGEIGTNRFFVVLRPERAKMGPE